MYKVLTKENKGEYSGFDYSKYLPSKNKKGKWLPRVKDLKMRNKGYHVTPYWNTGDRNTGYRNTGNWNKSNYHTGSFNTKPVKTVLLFNKPINKKEYDKISFPNWLFFDLEKDYKKSFIKAFNKATIKEIKDTINLPNFDYEVFKEISGISKTMITKKLKYGV